MIDLHSHTTASDGQHTPDELLAMAHAAGVTTLAVTDHDTVAGLAASTSAAARHGIELVPGIELSAFIGRKEIHVLGHFVDAGNAPLAAFSDRLRIERRSRMEQMVAKMKWLGFPITLDDVLAIAKDAHLGRPHLARVLVEKRYCLDTKEAFDRYLGDGKPAFIERFRVSSEDGIALIRQAGGTATLAHPAVSRVFDHEILALKQEGLSGLEVYHSDHGTPIRERLLALAGKLDLIPTAGSDFHGQAVAPNRKLGSAAMEPRGLEALRARRS